VGRARELEGYFLDQLAGRSPARADTGLGRPGPELGLNGGSGWNAN